jgi:hypothetical protein
LGDVTLERQAAANTSLITMAEAWAIRSTFRRRRTLQEEEFGKPVTERRWRNYEEVARYLIDQFASHFGLDRVERKQFIHSRAVPDERWEIDAKGVRDADGAFFIFEMRRKTTSRMKKEDMAAVAFRLSDTGAEGGFTVSPRDPQSGAERLAAASNILHVTLTPESTTTEYLMVFLNQTFAGIHETLKVTDHVESEVIKGKPS